MAEMLVIGGARYEWYVAIITDIIIKIHDHSTYLSHSVCVNRDRIVTSFDLAGNIVGDAFIITSSVVHHCYFTTRFFGRNRPCSKLRELLSAFSNHDQFIVVSQTDKISAYLAEIINELY
jgi:hypothetical protein